MSQSILAAIVLFLAFALQAEATCIYATDNYGRRTASICNGDGR